MALPGGSIGLLTIDLDLDPERYVKSQQALYKDATETCSNLEANFKKLGIHSAAEMDLMASKAIRAYEMIADASRATGNDVIRAEQAKNEKLIALYDENFRTLGIKSSAAYDVMRDKYENAYKMIALSADSSKESIADLVRAEEAKVARFNELNEQQYGHQKTLEESYRDLGIHSSAEMDQMRANITNSYDMIVNSGEKSAEELKRIEEAKNKQLDELNEQQFGKQKSLLDELKEHWIAVSAAVYAAYKATMKIFDMVEGWVQLDIAQGVADRSLKAVMQTTGRYSETFYQSTLQQAKAYEHLTGMSDQAIEGAQKFLMTIKGMANEYLPRATRATINLAAMMGGGEGSLHMAATSVDRALQGATEGLRRQGLVIDQSIFKERGIIGVLEELERLINGQADAMAKGSGQWKLLGNAIMETKESMGAFLDQILTGDDRLKWWIDSIRNLAEAIKMLSPSPQTKLDTLNDDLISAYKKLEQLKYDRSRFFGLTVSEGDVIVAEAKVELIRRQIDEEMKKIGSQLSDPLDEFLGKIKTTEQIAEESMKNIMDASGKYGIKDSQAEKNAENIIKLNEDIARKIKELSLSQYDYKKFLIDQEFEDQKSKYANIEDATKLHNLALEKLDNDLVAEEIKRLEKIVKAQDEADQKALKQKTEYWDKYFNLQVEMSDKLRGYKEYVPWQEIMPDLSFEGTLKSASQPYSAWDKRNKDILDKNIELQKKLAEQWNQIGKSIGSNFTSSFTDSIMGKKDAFRNLGEFIGTTMASAIVQKNITDKFIQPFIDKIMAGMAGNLVPAGTIPGAGQMVAPAWMGNYGNQIMGGIGAGAMGYGMGQSMGQSGIGTGLGAMGGFYLGGPAGAAMGGVAGTIAEGIVSNIFGEKKKEITLKDIFSEQIFSDVQTNFSQSIGQGFLDVLQTGEYQSFKDEFEKGLSTVITNSFKSMFISQLMGPLTQIFKPMFDAMATYQSEQIYWQAYQKSLSNPYSFWDPNKPPKMTTSLEDITKLTPGQDQIEALFTQYEPVLNSFSEALKSITDALGLNTSATEASTTSLQTYSSSVDSFLAELSGGSLAPSQSTAGMMEQYNSLYNQALLDPSKFAALSGFVGGSYLPGLQGISPDYAGSYAGVVSQLGGLKTAWGMSSLDTASSPVNPADYAMPTVAGQTQGPWFKQMVKEAFQEVAREQFAGWFLDLKTATEAPKNVSGDITIKGSIGSLMITEIKSNPDVRAQVHNA